MWHEFVVFSDPNGIAGCPHKNSAALLLRRRSISSDNQGTIRSWLYRIQPRDEGLLASYWRAWLILLSNMNGDIA